MELRQVGKSDLNITPVGLGAWAMGGEGVFGWGPQEDAESVAAIHRSVERGINWIDTAPIYGMGHSEKIVARALKEMNPEDRPMVFTKCSIVWDDEKNVDHSLKAGSVRKEVEDSLERLDVDVLDLAQVHRPSWPVGAPDPDLEEGWTTLAELKAEGKIRHIAVSNFDVVQMERAQAIAPITSLQPPYSMLMRQIEDDILPFCLENNIGVLPYSTMQNGLLTGRWTRERYEALPPTDWRVQFKSPPFQEPLFSQILELVEVLKEIGNAHGRSAAEVAVAWALHHPAVTGAIVGARSAEQVDGFAGAMEFRLSGDEYARIGEDLPESITLI
ncbi:MAG: aldo/keto reductase [Gemmatimonadetes bacterium]|nr:aldo/keto reductase [Gemmatimonadota bacterium]NNM06834.1 aldo/keto reductase [Gemmatimonadota bacterium]